MDELLERSTELSAIRESAEDAFAGRGRALVVEAPAGVGKTALVSATRAFAREAGLRPFGARGTELERAFGFGVVRQLLEPAVRVDGAATAVFVGAAGPAAPLLDLELPDAQPLPAGPEAALTIQHALYRLVVNLAEQRPVALVVDDAHWADGASLRFFAYLGGRLEGLPLLLVLAARPPGEPGSVPVASRLAEGGVRDQLHPTPLSEPAARQLVKVIVPDATDERVSVASTLDPWSARLPIRLPLTGPPRSTQLQAMFVGLRADSGVADGGWEIVSAMLDPTQQGGARSAARGPAAHASACPDGSRPGIEVDPGDGDSDDFVIRIGGARRKVDIPARIGLIGEPETQADPLANVPLDEDLLAHGVVDLHHPEAREEGRKLLDDPALAMSRQTKRKLKSDYEIGANSPGLNGKVHGKGGLWWQLARAKRRQQETSDGGQDPCDDGGPTSGGEPSGPSGGEGSLYIDPSGRIVSTKGIPLRGARVRLSRSATATAPLARVLRGSTVMSPSNRRNPDRSTILGRFGWDVIPGYYRVAATRHGCTAGRRARTRRLRIPPPVTHLVLRLRCAHLQPRARTRTRATLAEGPFGSLRLRATVRLRSGRRIPHRKLVGAVRFKSGKRIVTSLAPDARSGQVTTLLSSRRGSAAA